MKHFKLRNLFLLSLMVLEIIKQTRGNVYSMYSTINMQPAYFLKFLLLIQKILQHAWISRKTTK